MISGSREIKSELNAALRSFIGLTCWECAAAASTGSVISLHFGDKIKYKAPLGANGNIPEHEGSFTD
jgi:hypothetical protein